MVGIKIKNIALVFSMPCLLICFCMGCSTQGGKETQTQKSNSAAETSHSGTEDSVKSRLDFFSGTSLGVDQAHRSRTIVELLRSYSLCRSYEDVDHSFEFYLLESVEELFYRQESVNTYYESIESESDAIFLAGDSLLLLGWKAEGVDDLVRQLLVRANKAGLERKELYSDKGFQAFLKSALEYKEKRELEHEKKWPWGERPELWNGIRTPKK